MIPSPVTNVKKKLLKQLASNIVFLYCTIIYLISTGGKEIVFRNNPNTGIRDNSLEIILSW